MDKSISLGGRISRAITVTALSFFFMIYAFHFISWFPNFWGGLSLLVKKYIAGDLGRHFLGVWLKAMVYSCTHWKGALEISASMEAALFAAWQVDKFFMRYHSRFLRDAPKK